MFFFDTKVCVKTNNTAGNRLNNFTGTNALSHSSLYNNFVMFFENVKQSKTAIYKALRGKSGVYLFINNATKDLYVGSSLTLSKTMTSHFYLANSHKVTNIVLVRAMRKYILDNFSLAILEICASDIIVCSDLEQK